MVVDEPTFSFETLGRYVPHSFLPIQQPATQRTDIIGSSLSIAIGRIIYISNNVSSLSPEPSLVAHLVSNAMVHHNSGNIKLLCVRLCEALESMAPD